MTPEERYAEAEEAGLQFDEWLERVTREGEAQHAAELAAWGGIIAPGIAFWTDKQGRRHLDIWTEEPPS
jgi:hypothetical protein